MSVNATPITVVGRVVTDMAPRVTAAGDKVVNFRLACQERVYDRTQDLWTDGDRMYLTVVCWRAVAEHVADSLRKGDQVVVTGRLRIREYSPEEGGRKTTLEVTATAIGPDLSRHTVTVNRSGWGSAPRQPTLVSVPPDPRSPAEEEEEAVRAA